MSMSDGSYMDTNDVDVLMRYAKALKVAESKGLTLTILEKEKKFRLMAGKWIILEDKHLSYIETRISTIKIGDETS